MEKKIYEKITEDLYKFIYNYEETNTYISLEELILSEKFCNIILGNFNFKNYLVDFDFNKKININKSLEYTLKFLDSINLKYSNKLKENLNDGTLEFCEDTDDVSAYAYFKDGKRKIVAPIRNNISDTFAITHEQIHDITISEGAESISWSYFAEVPTFLIELLQADFMKKQNKKLEINKYQKYSISSCIHRALKLKVAINLIKEILNDGCINKMTICDLFIEIYNICKDEDLTYEVIDMTLDSITNEEEIFYFFDLRYIIGTLLGCYTHNKILDNPKLLKEFSEYNEMFYDLDIRQVFMSLGLYFDEDSFFDLDNDSYKKLEKSFKKELKRVW